MKYLIIIFIVVLAASCKTIMDPPYCDESERTRKVEIEIVGEKDLYSVSRFWLINYFINTPVNITYSQNNSIQGYFYNVIYYNGIPHEIKSVFEIFFNSNKVVFRIQNPCFLNKVNWYYLKNKSAMDSQNLYWSKLITDYTSFINNY